MKDMYKKTDKNKFGLDPKTKRKGELFDLDPKSKSKKLLDIGKKGQMGGALIGGLVIMILAVIIFIALTPAVDTVMDEVRGCTNFNCAGYIDADASSATCSATNQSYTAARETKSLACTTTDIFLPLLILSVLGAIIMLLFGGQLFRPQQQDLGGGF